MLSLSEHQSHWRQALLAPDETLAASRHPALSIHRNNFFHATRSALSSHFPTVQALVGKAFFLAMAKDFIVASPPTSPVIMNYGAEFGDFIRAYPQAGDLPYLGDMACFEWVLHEVRHAARIPALEPQSFSRLAPEDLLALELELVPGARLFASEFSVVPIWHAHRGHDQTLSDIGPIDRPCSVIAICRGPSVAITDLTQGETVLLKALEEGADLGTAMANALAEDLTLDVPHSVRKLAQLVCLKFRDDASACA